MPQGPGTYGSKIGRPPKPRQKKLVGGSLKHYYPGNIIKEGVFEKKVKPKKVPKKPRVKKKRGGTAKGKSSLTKKDNLSLLVTKKPKTKMIT